MIAHHNNGVTAFPYAEMRPMSGATELGIAEAASQPRHRPEKVSHVLNAVYETISGQVVTLDFVRHLPSGSREWLLQQAAHYFHPEIEWFETSCVHCDQLYDISLNLNQPAKHSPKENVLQIEVETSLGNKIFEIPNGLHEEAFSKSEQDLGDPRRLFIALCSESNNAIEDALQYNEHDLVLIDEAMEKASPEIADITLTICPSCGNETSAQIEPLIFAFPKEGKVLQETHLIASSYGWSYEQILNLNIRHRSFYASMIKNDNRQFKRIT